ncbi:phosphoenolpyruvate--protein phosphotransferase [candidate division KSB1 bacterium]|nr:phosphoenolpyruvate--protein phosphotransferase [candidate division KSB1 bacterium]NIT71182.1 phosphoenolpyruvate--protein phosphotransferase [candidate division KSB1 bacterium]NIX70862.1 phosphoenolpyruvate--protein phosphotransferase [candidate division KSB1 bacterium]
MTTNHKNQGSFVLKGIAASPGIAISKVFLLRGEAVKIDTTQVESSELEAEVQKFNNAIQKAKNELRALQNRVAQRIGQESAKIFDVHQLLLEDSIIIEETLDAIKKENKSAGHAFYDTMQKYQNTLDESSVEYFQGRISDLKDVKRRVIRHIQGDRTDYLSKLEGSAVIVARDLTPSDTVMLDKRKVLGFATDLGGRFSHVAIMARSMEVPAVAGLRRLSSLVQEGDRLIIDGNAGKVIIHPDEKTLTQYRRLQEKYYEVEQRLSIIRDLPCITLDGKEIELSANLEFSDEVESAKSHGANGIGLYRSDYIYLAKKDLPTEEEQFEEYSKIVKEFPNDPVIIRTMDLGGDKHPQSILIPPEENPFLGWRAVRISLEREDIFNVQLRAILRASVFGNVKILIPMISSLQEILECKTALEKAKSELREEDIPFNPDIDVGVMIEVPSAALLADKIAREVDFLSIGTNDLVQYLLAVDRGNERIAYLYKHLHPAVLRMIKDIIIAGHQQGVWVGMCGEMASDPLATLILVGLDLDEFSVSPFYLPEIKKIIRSVDHSEAERIAERVLEFETACEVEKFMTRIMRKNFKDLII